MGDTFSIKPHSLLEKIENSAQSNGNYDRLAPWVCFDLFGLLLKIVRFDLG